MRVHDLDRAIALHREKLGLRFLFQVPGMAFFDCQGIRLLLSLPEGEAFDHPASIIYFRVPDIRAWTDDLKKRGVEFTGEPALIAKMPDHDLWMSFFRDVHGNTMALMSEVHQPVTWDDGGWRKILRAGSSPQPGSLLRGTKAS